MYKLLLLTATLIIASPVLAAPPAYVGSWGDGRDGCQAEGDLVPTQISEDAIEFYDTACDLKSVVQKGRTWTARAVCSGEGQTWTDRIAMTVSGDTLVFSRNDDKPAKLVRCP